MYAGSQVSCVQVCVCESVCKCVCVCEIIPTVHLGPVKVMVTGVIFPSRRCHVKCVMSAERWPLL